MYAAGAPVGFLIDSYGPRLGVLTGAFLMGLGYTLLHRGMGISKLQLEDRSSLRTDKHTIGVLDRYRCHGYVSSPLSLELLAPLLLLERSRQVKSFGPV